MTDNYIKFKNIVEHIPAKDCNLEYFSFKFGGVWESSNIEIRPNYVHSQSEEKLEFTCSHAIKINKNHELWLKGDSGCLKFQWIIPRVVVGWNEGGHCDTGLCLDCVILAAQILDKMMEISK